MPAGNSWILVKGKTNGEGEEVKDSCYALITDLSRITNVAPDPFTLPSGGNAVVNYSVEDANGMPLASGTQVSVSLVGDADTLASVTTDFPEGGLNDLNKGIQPGDNFSSLTDYTFTITRDEGVINNDIDISVKIEVVSPNGDVTRTVTGTVQSP